MGFRDRERAEDCYPQLASDAAYRCLPRQTSETGYYFADETCTQVLLWSINDADCAEHPKFASVLVADSCPARFRVVAVTPVTEGKVYINFGSGPCMEETTRNVAELNLYRAGEEVSPSAFVAFTERRDPLSDEFAQKSLIGEDGSRVLSAWEYAGKNERCSPVVTSDGARRCVPYVSPRIQKNHFADAACTEAAAVATSLCDAPGFALKLDEEQCRYDIHRVGAEVSGYSMSGDGVCRAVAQGPSALKRYSLGEKVPPAEFPEIPLEQGERYGRLQRLETRFGERVVAGGLRDTELDVDCSPGLLEDGRLRCIPSVTASIESSQFMDADCSRKVVSVSRTVCGAPKFAYEEAEGCNLSSAYRVGPPYEGQLYFKARDGSCSTTDSVSTRRYYEAGERLPASSFVLLEEPGSDR